MHKLVKLSKLTNQYMFSKPSQVGSKVVILPCNVYGDHFQMTMLNCVTSVHLEDWKTVP